LIGISILAGLLFLGALLLFFPLRIRFYFVGAKKDSLIEIRLFKWKLFTTKENPSDETTESNVGSDATNKDALDERDETTEIAGIDGATAESELFENTDRNVSEATDYDEDDESLKNSGVSTTESEAAALQTAESKSRKNQNRNDETHEILNSDAVESSTYPHSETHEAMSCRATETVENTESDVSDEDAKITASTESTKADEKCENPISESAEKFVDSGEETLAKGASMDDSEMSETIESDVTDEATNTDASKGKDSKASKKLRELTEKEFLTLMFNPKLHSMVLRMAWKLLRRAWRLFTIRFEHTVVQGIRMEYDEMGVVSAFTSFFTSQFSLFKNWDIQMDWLKEKEPEIRGSILIRFRLFFFLLWSLMALFFAARVYFWYRRNKKRFIENPLPFRLVFWRRKIIDLIAAEE